MVILQSGRLKFWGIGRKAKSHKAQFLLLGALAGPQAPEEIFISHWTYFLRSMQSNLFERVFASLV